jgi:TolB-like protein/Tfp pilus assembly protein PilF
MASPVTLRFGDFRIDPRSGELRRQGVKIKLQEQPFQVLALLVTRHGEVVTREELRLKLWAADSFIDFDNGLNIAIRKLRQALGDNADTPRYIETLPRRGYRFIAAVTAAEKVAGAPIRSIAVLPFRNLSGESSEEYFSDGVTEELITNLARIGSLRVISSTSAMRYKATTKTMPEIGRELGVDAIVEGAVLRAGGRVRITAQLIRAAEDAHVWAESYEQGTTDVLGVQRQVAQAIVEEIRVALMPHERERLSRAASVDPKAYDAYLKGRYHTRKLTADGLRKGFDYFRQAIAIDPGYAPVYAGIAYYYLAQVEWAMAPLEALPQAKRSAEKAIELDSELAEAHLTLGATRLWLDHDWKAADRAFQRAIELAPNDATTRQHYAQCLAWVGHATAALREARRAVQLDPVSVEAARILGEVLYFANDYSAAIAQLHEALAIEPDYWFAHLTLGRAYVEAGRHAEAIAASEIATRIEPVADSLATLGMAYAAAGQKAKAKDVLGELMRRAETGYVPSYNMALVCARLGDVDRALQWLERAFAERSIFLTWLGTDPALNPLRSNPRFEELQRRITLR